MGGIGIDGQFAKYRLDESSDIHKTNIMNIYATVGLGSKIPLSTNLSLDIALTGKFNMFSRNSSKHDLNYTGDAGGLVIGLVYTL